MNLLSLGGVAAGYGPVQALFGVDLEVGVGEAVALMGRNGMGKTTVIRTVCAMLPHTAGRILWEGAPMPARLHAVARLGIGLVPEGRRLFATLTVRENLIAAARPGPWDATAVEALLPRLAERRHQRASTLSGGEQQMAAIGRALMTNPRLLILDEATEGLAPLVRSEIWAALARVRRDSGMALLIVDKSPAELARIVDRAVVIERGRSVWSGPVAEVDSARYLGV